MQVGRFSTKSGCLRGFLSSKKYQSCEPALGNRDIGIFAIQYSYPNRLEVSNRSRLTRTYEEKTGMSEAIPHRRHLLSVCEVPVTASAPRTAKSTCLVQSSPVRSGPVQSCLPLKAYGVHHCGSILLVFRAKLPNTTMCNLLLYRSSNNQYQRRRMRRVFSCVTSWIHHHHQHMDI